ncbi:MAG: LruC domain-containing protein, partial [Bacteroidota bacterium]
MKYYTYLLIAFLFINGCSDKDHIGPNDNDDNIIETMEDLQVSDDFDFSTSSDVQFRITALNNRGNAIANAKIKIMDKPQHEGGKVLLSGATNQNGVFESVYPLPDYYTEVLVTSDYIGLTSDLVVQTDGAEFIEATLGGLPQKSTGFAPPTKASADFPFTVDYLGDFNGIGVPEYLVENDEITQDFLDDINATLPETEELFNSHPEYLDPNNKLNVELNEMAEVWVTFVHEGAGFKNVLGFYTYDLDNPPQSPEEIEKVTTIFPNISYAGSGGGLYSGNKVRLGVFEENTGIGFALFANGWESEVTEGENIFYSNPEFNFEADPDLKQHTVLIQDVLRERFILAFEDLARDNSGSFRCDHDFNDAVFYVTSNPFEAVDSEDIPPIDTGDDDTDDDGIPDSQDDYPNDPDKAFDNNYEGSLAFEDLWPGKGDYDFNDIVIDYEIDQVTNSANKVSAISAKYTLRAYGAEYHNGFGFEMNVEPSKIASVSGSQISDNYISLSGNGTEANQENAVVIVFDDAYDVLPYPGSGIGVNTNPDFEYVEPVDINVEILFSEPVSVSSIGTPPYNPFIIADGQRGYEIHLSDKEPTSLIDEALLGQWEDDSQPGMGRYFKTEGNLPWGINIAGSFDYPIEKVQIIDAHLKFAEWAQSSGELFPDWYLDEDGYRNDSN